MATCMVIEVYKDTTSLRPTKPAQILKYDPLYLTSTDQPNASHGYWSTPSNRCWRTFQHIYSLELTKCIQAGDFTTNKSYKTLPYPCSLLVVTTTTKHQNAFDDTLRLNGYPGNRIHQTKCPQSHQRRRSTYQRRIVISNSNFVCSSPL